MKTLYWSIHLLILMILTSCMSSCGLLPKKPEVVEAERQSIEQKRQETNTMANKIIDNLFTFLLIALLVPAFLVSCTSKPKMKAVVVVDPETGMKVTTLVPDLGGSLMTKKDIEAVKYEGADGTKISYFAMNNDETVVPGKAIDSYTTLGLASEVRKLAGTVPGTDKGKALVKGTKDPNVIPVDPNIPTEQIVPAGTVTAPLIRR